MDGWAIIFTKGALTSSPGFRRGRGSLEHVLEAYLFPVFGEMRYLTLFGKAAALTHTIICTHVFRDGNKRTVLICCMAMCEINGYFFVINSS